MLFAETNFAGATFGGQITAVDATFNDGVPAALRSVLPEVDSGDVGECVDRDG